MTDPREPGPLRLVAARLSCAVVLALVVACGGGGEQPVAEVVTEPPPVERGAEGPSGATGSEVAAPLRVQVVEIYFPSAVDDGLVAEAREIFVTAAPGDRAKQILADLISGPTTELALRALPGGTRLRQVYVLENGIAYVDFSEDLREGLGGGSAEELFAVYSVVDSVVLNIPEIDRVGIMINGEPIDTLNGHMDLRRPLGPNIDLIVGRVAEVEPEPAIEADALTLNRQDERRSAGATSGS